LLAFPQNGQERYALTSLINKQVLAIAKWGGEPNDWQHPDNQWQLPL
jgi:hypothetical protein